MRSSLSQKLRASCQTLSRFCLSSLPLQRFPHSVGNHASTTRAALPGVPSLIGGWKYKFWLPSGIRVGGQQLFTDDQQLVISYYLSNLLLPIKFYISLYILYIVVHLQQVFTLRRQTWRWFKLVFLFCLICYWRLILYIFYIYCISWCIYNKFLYCGVQFDS